MWICPAEFKRVSGWFEHQSTHKITRDFSCELYQKVFIDRNSASTLKTKHWTEVRYQCSVEGCESVLYIKHSYSVHVKTKHININARIKCGLWDKDFMCEASERVHRIYTNEAEKKMFNVPNVVVCGNKWKEWYVTK